MRHEWFPDDWIEPNEFSFCSRCGHKDTLRKEYWKSRPPCPLCKNHLPVIGAAPGFIGTVIHATKLVISGKYRGKFIESRMNDRKKTTQKALADTLHIERSALATHRKEVLDFPPLFWMKENH